MRHGLQKFCGVACVLAGWALAIGCGGGGGDDDADGGVDGPGSMCVPGNPLDLNHTYGVLATLNVHVNSAGLVETDTVSEMLLLFDSTQTGTAVSVSATLCDIEIPEIQLMGTPPPPPVIFRLGPGLIASVADTMGMATLGGTQSCATFATQPMTIVIGAKLANPTQGMLPQATVSGSTVTVPECMPTGATCATATGTDCACDQENDMKPGATLLAMNTPVITLDEAYVDLRTTFSLSGQVLSSDAIQGTLTATLEQGVLGCHCGSNPGGTCDMAPCGSAEVNVSKTINPVITQNAMPSTFRAVRVDPSLTCAQLVSMRDTIFPR